MPASEFGQHTEEVLQEYGYTQEDIVWLKEQRVIAWEKLSKRIKILGN